VVVAIIGILVSIRLPSLSKAREKAQEAVCKSNMKQIGTAQFMYLNNNREKFSPSLIGNVSWDDSLADILGRILTQSEKNATFLPDSVNVDNRILQCASDDRSFTGKSKRSYAMNSGGTFWAGGSFTGITRLSRSVFIAEVKEPSNTIMYGERFNNGNRIGQNGSTELGDYHTGHWKKAVHSKVEFYMTVFCDGHIEYLHGGVIDPEKMDRE
jgi:type II secretory pathway pseudopilin PulG